MLGTAGTGIGTKVFSTAGILCTVSSLSTGLPGTAATASGSTGRGRLGGCTGGGCTGGGCTAGLCTGGGCTGDGCTGDGCTSGGCSGGGCTGGGCTRVACIGSIRCSILGTAWCTGSEGFCFDCTVGLTFSVDSLGGKVKAVEGMSEVFSVGIVEVISPTLSVLTMLFISLVCCCFCCVICSTNFFCVADKILSLSLCWSTLFVAGSLMMSFGSSKLISNLNPGLTPPSLVTACLTSAGINLSPSSSPG